VSAVVRALRFDHVVLTVRDLDRAVAVLDA
jgi:catechol 2,3-dioxygenase-like lactoylglutathione lyase family enzyme